jgi:hypothetical protein
MAVAFQTAVAHDGCRGAWRLVAKFAKIQTDL